MSKEGKQASSRREGGRSSHVTGRRGGGEAAVSDDDVAGGDLGVEGEHALLDGILEAEALDQHLTRLPQPVDPPRRLHLLRGEARAG